MVLREKYQELMDDPQLPFADMIELLEEMDLSNQKYGIYEGFIEKFEKWFFKNDFVSLPKPVKILEIGAGSGGLILELDHWRKRKGIVMEFHSMDMRPDVAQWCQKRLQDKGMTVFTHLAGDKHLGQFSDGEFDLIYSLHVLHHIEDEKNLRLALRDSLRVARHGVFMGDFERKLWVLPLCILMNKINRVEKKSSQDGITSIRRAYTAAELRAFMRDIAVGPWTCEVKPVFFWPYLSLECQSEDL